MSYKLDKLRGIEWLELSKIHLSSAIILSKNNGNNGIICYHIQQAIEKCLKGYILIENGVLIDEHSIISLVNVAAQCNPLFAEFIQDAPYIGTFYIGENYPSEDPLLITKKEVEYAFEVYYKIHDVVEKILNEVYIH